MPFPPIRARVETIAGDLYALGYIADIGALVENRTFNQDKLVDNDLEIPVSNIDGFFSVENPKSLFYKSDWYLSPLQIYDTDGIIIWNGILWEIKRDCESRTATLVSTSELSVIQKIKIDYESADWETCADAMMNIFAAYGFSGYDAKSLQDSKAVLEAAGCYVKVNINPSDNLSMHSAIEKLAGYSCADAYSHLGKVYFKVWKYLTTRTGTIQILETDFLRSPTVHGSIADILNDYNIGYTGDGGTPATDAANGNLGANSRALYGIRSLPELSTAENNQITYKDLASAVWVGEQYIRRTHRDLLTRPKPLMKLEFKISDTLRNFIDLETILSLTHRDEAFAALPFEVFGFSRNNLEATIEISGYGVAS